MTHKFRNKILYVLLPMILVIGIYGSQTSNELSGYFKSYPVKNSNNILTISIDKHSYQPGQTINILGKVNKYDEGTKVIIQLVGPDRSIVGNFDSLLDRYGIFESSFAIPDTISDGKYVLSAYYDGDSHRNQVYITINISSQSYDTAYILIPQGASSQDSKINFDPPAVNVTEGTKIVLINNDGTIHSFVSGIVNDNGNFTLDKLFADSYVTPGNKLVIYLAPGKYSYFDKFYPWLGGTITVKANPALAKTPLKPSITAAKIKSKVSTNATSTAKTKTNPFTAGISTTSIAKTKTKLLKVGTNATSTKSKPFPVSNNMLISIWKERKDLQKSYPEVAHGNIVNLTKWATSTGWNQDKHLSALIPRGKVPAYLDSVLKTIWEERKDLQKSYPEVAHGDFSKISKWATSTGWSQDSRLSVLIPPGQKPKY